MTKALQLILTDTGIAEDTYEDVNIHEHIGIIPRTIHREIVKPISYWFSSRILKNEMSNAIDDIIGKSIMDVSAGDDSTLLELASKANKVIANDISTIEMQPLMEQAHLFSNLEFNVCNLVRLRRKADVVICKNTLHHMNTCDQLSKALRALRRCGKERIVIMDIEHPRGSFISRMWNNYYRYLLKDQGGFFITYDQFVRVIQVVFGDCKLETKKVKTIKGSYMLAVIER